MLCAMYSIPSNGNNKNFDVTHSFPIEKSYTWLYLWVVDGNMDRAHNSIFSSCSRKIIFNGSLSWSQECCELKALRVVIKMRETNDIVCRWFVCSLSLSLCTFIFIQMPKKTCACRMNRYFLVRFFFFVFCSLLCFFLSTAKRESIQQKRGKKKSTHIYVHSGFESMIFSEPAGNSNITSRPTIANIHSL